MSVGTSKVSSIFESRQNVSVLVVVNVAGVVVRAWSWAYERLENKHMNTSLSGFKSNRMVSLMAPGVSKGFGDACYLPLPCVEGSSRFSNSTPKRSNISNRGNFVARISGDGNPFFNLIHSKRPRGKVIVRHAELYFG